MREAATDFLRLADYRVTSQLHEGAHTVVFRGLRLADQAPVVLKTLRHESPTPEQFSRWSHEFEVLRQLAVPGAPRAHELLICDNRPVLVLEDVGGRCLREHQAGRKLDLEEFFRLALATVEALGQVHDSQVVHKNINPANLVWDGHHLQIIDFGIASVLSRQSSAPAEILSSPEGNLAYLAPEQTGRINRGVDQRSDFYALGVTFYELLTGQLPFQGADRMELIHAHIAKRAIPPRQLSAHVPEVLCDLVMKLLAKTAEERYQSCAGLQADLRTCQAAWTSQGCIPPLALGRSDQPDRLQVPQKLYGREAEIEKLLGAFRRASLGSTELVLVGGHSGIGKSALVHEIRKPITQLRGFFLMGKCEQYHRNRPYQALIQALAELAPQMLIESEARVARWRTAVLAALGPNGRVITELVPALKGLLGPQPELAELPPAEAQNRFQLVIGNFVRALARPEHPLVLALDDLQWADLPTLEVLELLVSDPQPQALLVVATFRDNQVDGAHPLMLLADRLGIPPIRLQPLVQEQLGELLADTLACPARRVRDLARFFKERTAGNPFFVNQLLGVLYEQRAIRLDRARGCWTWDLKAIRAVPMTSDLAQMMAARIKTLPSASQQVLKLAACVGHSFDLKTLSLVCGQSVLRTGDDLLACVRDGLIAPVGQRYPVLEGIRLKRELAVYAGDLCYAFLHDQIQRAAYALIAETQKQEVHLGIGRLLLENLSEARQQERLFEIVSHLNQGAALIRSPAEQGLRLRLNLRAGQKARQAAAYPLALAYFSTAMELLGRGCWKRDYALSLEIYLEATEAAYLSADFAMVERLTGVVLRRADSVMDRVRGYAVKIQALVARRQLLAAVDTGFAVLKLLGIRFPKVPGPAQIGAELQALAAAVPAHSLQALSQLPPMTDPHQLAAMRILSAVFSSVYLSSPQFLPFLVSQQVQLSARHGHAPSSAYAYATYGLMLCGVMGDIEAGYRFGTLALELQRRFDDPSQKCRVYHIVYTFTRPWKEHTRSTLSPLLEAYQCGLDHGDFEYAGYASLLHCYYSYFAGRELGVLEAEMSAFAPVMRRIGQEINFRYHSIWHQAVHNLMGHNAEPARLVGERFDDGEMLHLHQEANDRTGLFFIYFNRMVLEYLFHQPQAARATAELVEQHLDAVVAVMAVAIFYFYDALIRLAVGEESLERVESHLERLRRWAAHAPMNYQHKADLVEAELARVQGQESRAIRLYEQAIAGAAAHQYLQEEALAYELAAAFYAHLDLTRLARNAAGQAHARYTRWGATAKAQDLEARWGLASSPSSGTLPTLDLESVLKASAAISRELVLSELVSNLLQVSMENAGADRGLLLVPQAGGWEVLAQRVLDQEVSWEGCSLESSDGQGLTLAPVGLIHYVARTGELVVDPGLRFASEPYLKARAPQSLLCMPLLQQGQAVGILYLENRLTQAAFTPQRLEVLRLLSGQAAISLANARLFANLEEAGQELERKERQLAQFLEAVPVGVFVADAQGRPLYANTEAQRILGRGVAPLASREQLAETYQIYQAGTDLLFPTEELPIVQALGGRSVSLDNLEVHDGQRRRRLSVTATPILDEEGVIRYGIAAFQDITEILQDRERRQHQERLLGQVSQFFSPSLRHLLVDQGWEEVMRPARRQVTVLFFDLRGFSRATEAASAADLSDPLDRVLAHHSELTEVMTAVTDCVFAHQGVVVDYQGDAVMACWGVLSDQGDHAQRAVLAAREICSQVSETRLPFGSGPARCGLGLGSGEVVAGQVGARHQVKFGVMGNVVNQASRLEGLTKYLGVPILINADVRRGLGPDILCRRVGRVRPAGLRDSVEVHEVVVGREQGGSGLSAAEVGAYERAEAHFAAGRMVEAIKALREVPVEDPVASFLIQLAYDHRGGVPAGWQGVIEFSAK